jgi:hypothetical protein
MTNGASDPLELAREALAAGEPQEALRRARPAFAYPGPDDPALLHEGLALLLEIGRAMGDPHLPPKLEAALANEQADRLYDVGYEMIEVGLEAYAGVVLERALALSPGEGRIVTELVCALERSQAFEHACEVLRAHPDLLAAGFTPSYLLAFNALMTGDLDEPARLLPALREQADGERHTFMVQRIESALARAEQVRPTSSLDRSDLRGWHWVITGSLLTHRSPHGLDAGMNGRYAFLQDRPGLCRLGVERLAAVVEALELEFPCVIGLPERGAQVLARAVAQRLTLPLGEWPEGGPQEPALLVAYDLRLCQGPALKPLVTRHAGQLLWAHATCWTEHFPVVADATTLLYQHMTPFFGEGMVVDAETGAVGRGQADERDPDALAVEVLGAEVPADDGDPADHQALLSLARAAGCAHIQQGGRREAMWFGSPVGSNRFL